MPITHALAWAPIWPRAPPKAQDPARARKFGPGETAFAGGWMALRGIRRRRSGDRGFVISDHADRFGLLEAITQTGAENIYLTNGYRISSRATSMKTGGTPELTTTWADMIEADNPATSASRSFPFRLPHAPDSP